MPLEASKWAFILLDASKLKNSRNCYYEHVRTELAENINSVNPLDTGVCVPLPYAPQLPESASKLLFDSVVS